MQYQRRTHPGLRMDEAVIRRAQQGEIAAVEALYSAHYESVFRYLYYQVGDAQTAEDLTAEVFERMLRALPKYTLQGIPFQAWLFRIARNIAVDTFRKARMRQFTALFDTLQSTGKSPEALTEQSLTSERLAYALKKLRKNQRDVIIFRFILEMPIAEVARVMGKPEDAIKGLQRRGLIALRDLLVDWMVRVDYDEAG
jgi:RNA polymerase sigma-70 factor, ECF subfamily